MNKLNNKFDFNISKNFVDPLFPKYGDNININFIASNDATKLYLNYKKNGNWNTIELSKKRKINDLVSLFETQFIIEEKTLLYFSIEVDYSYFYYSKLGFTTALVSDIDCFEILLDIEAPLWVSASTCYQIFPDRFKNGNNAIGVKSGEYYFDGSKPRQMSFDEKPLSFDQGKCLDFFNGDLKGIETSLDYLISLGVNCIYLNPIGVSRTTHRYDCCDFFHVDPNLGGDDALVSLIKAAHDKKIKVIVDISINHTGIEHPWFIKGKNDKNSREAAYYYIDSNNEISYWQNVKTLPQLNYNNQDLRDLIYKSNNSVIKKFLKEPFNQDGWRFDVADEVGRKDKDQFNDEIWEEVRKSIKDVKKDAYILGESWIDSSSHLDGSQWDATMNYVGSSRPLRRWMGEEDRFTCLDWGHSPRKVNEYSAKDLSIALNSQLKSIPSQMAQFQFNLIDSHDTPRLHNNREVFNFKKYCGAIMLIYTLPGMPSIYYGDEIAIDGEMGSVEMSRYPMQWDKEKWNKDFFNLYTTLGSFRKKYHDVLYLSSYKILNLHDDLFVLARYNEKYVIFTILNKSNTSILLDIDIPNLYLNKCVDSVFNTKISEKTLILEKGENSIVVFDRV